MPSIIVHAIIVVVGAVRNGRLVRQGRNNTVVDAVVDVGEALGMHDGEMPGDILDCSKDDVGAVGADWHGPLDINDGRVGQRVEHVVVDRQLVGRMSVQTSHHELRHTFRRAKPTAEESMMPANAKRRSMMYFMMKICLVLHRLSEIEERRKRR